VGVLFSEEILWFRIAFKDSENHRCLQWQRAWSQRKLLLWLPIAIIAIFIIWIAIFGVAAGVIRLPSDEDHLELVVEHEVPVFLKLYSTIFNYTCRKYLCLVLDIFNKTKLILMVF